MSFPTNCWFLWHRAASECEPLLRASGQSHSDCQLATDGNDNFEATFSHSDDEPERIWMWSWNGVECTMIFILLIQFSRIISLDWDVWCCVECMLPSATINLDVRVKIVRLVKVSDEWKLCYRLHVSWESSERCYLVWFFFTTPLFLYCAYSKAHSFTSATSRRPANNEEWKKQHIGRRWEDLNCWT